MEKESHESTENLLIEWAVAERSLGGYAESGDGYVVQAYPHGVLVAVIDGLGHGDRAADVSKMAVATLQSYAHEPISLLMKRCHESLKGSRGAVMSLASFNPLKSVMTWLGVGNVDGILLHGNTRENPVYKSLLLRGGVVGYRLPSLYETSLPVTPGDILIFVTDGIRSGFVKEQTQFYSVKQTLPVDRTQSSRQIADYILAHYGRTTDDALVLVARYRGGERVISLSDKCAKSYFKIKKPVFSFRVYFLKDYDMSFREPALNTVKEAQRREIFSRWMLEKDFSAYGLEMKFKKYVLRETGFWSFQRQE